MVMHFFTVAKIKVLHHQTWRIAESLYKIKVPFDRPPRQEYDNKIAKYTFSFRVRLFSESNRYLYQIVDYEIEFSTLLKIDKFDEEIKGSILINFININIHPGKLKDRIDLH